MESTNDVAGEDWLISVEQRLGLEPNVTRAGVGEGREDRHWSSRYDRHPNQKC